MDREELIGKIASSVGIRKKEANMMINLIVEDIVDTLGKEHSYRISGLGSFKVVIEDKNKGKNIYPEKAKVLPDKKTVVFKPGLNLRKKIQ